MQKRLKMLLCVLLTVLTCTSCTGVFADPQGLMRPPRAEGELAGMEEALYKAVGREFDFVYPVSGDYRSCTVTIDLTDDKQDEVLVFYSPKSNTSEIHINLLCKSGEIWVSTFDSALPGTGIDSVAFADLCDDDALEILIGSTLYNTREKQLDIYGLSEGKLLRKAQEPYTDYILCNMTGDNKPQILLVNQGTVTTTESNLVLSKTANAELISLNGKANTTTVIGTVDLDPNITGFSSLQYAQIGETLYGVYIDANKGASSMITELVYYEDGRLKNPFYNAVSGENELTRRDAPAVSRDIDADGYIEIPQAFPVPGFENKSAGETLYFYAWRRFDGQYFNHVMTTVLNTADGYYLKIPESWLGAVTVTRNTAQKLRIFSVWDFNSQKAGDELFRIQVFSEKLWNASEQTGFRQIISEKGLVYAVKISDTQNALALDYSDILNSFFILK